jgi:hypothetical protein
LVDFKTLRDNYVAQWEQLEFQSVFNEFIEKDSFKGYGIYKKASNEFSQNIEKIVLYIEPVGFTFQERVYVDEYKHTEEILYLSRFRSTIKVIGKLVPTFVHESPPTYLNRILSKNKMTEFHLVLQFNPSDWQLSIGKYTIEYTVTDNISKKSFEIIKDVKIVS